MNDNELTGWQKLCKQFGKIQAGDVTWIWDYSTNEPRKQSEMSALDVKKSNKAKWDKLKADAK